MLPASLEFSYVLVGGSGPQVNEHEAGWFVTQTRVVTFYHENVVTSNISTQNMTVTAKGECSEQRLLEPCST
jgi:hypothetical protein